MNKRKAFEDTESSIAQAGMGQVSPCSDTYHMQ